MAEIIKTVIDVDINTSGAAAELRSLQQQINAFNLTLNKGQLEQGQASKVFAEGLRNSINAGGFFRAEVVKMQTAAGALDATLRKGQGTLGQFFSASFNKQGGIAAEVFALAAERARTMQTQFIATAKASKGMQEALAVRPLTAFSAEAAISAQRMQILNSMFKQGTTGLINFGKNVQWTGRQLMVGFTIPLTIFGTTAGKVFSDLEKQAVAFKKVYGDIFTTPAELEENFRAVQGLSKEFTKYGIAAKDTLGLAAQAAAAGRKNTDLTDAVRESTRLATLGQMDQNAALETTISLQSAFRLSGQELADTINFLNMVENQTVVSLQDIASAIPRVAPVIKGLGGDVKDLTVFLAAMQEGGVSAEQGANALKSGLGSLINPTKAATDVLAGFKINLDSIIQTNRGDLMGTVTAFSQALSTLDEFSRQQALESLFGKFQYARLGALFENISREGSQAQQVISTLGYSTEQLAKSAEKELTTVEQAFSTQLTGAIERLKIAIAPLGEIFVKMAIPIVNMVTKMVESFNRLPEGVKNIAALATALGGVLLPAATMIFGLFANLIGTFAKFSHSMGMFGVTLLRKGPIAAIKSLTQSANYLSLSEIDAANAARQLGSATELANAALLSQVGSANSADVAIKNLTNSYRVLISEQTRASQVQPFLFGTGQAASSRVGGSAAASVAATMATRGKSRIKAVGLNQGGSVFTPKNSNTVPGVGNTDTVPAMLTPGEFVVNKESTQKNLGLLHAINDSQKLNIGGKVKNGIQYAMVGFQVGNIPGYSAATNTVAAKLARAGQAAVGRTRGAAPRIADEATQLKNNFVYLLNPTNNQQLTGVRTMAGFDKRGVPLDVLKQDMVSEDGLWMIDALAKGNWKKDEYRSTLENNFANIANKYSGKEIRFLDSAGLERVQPLLGKPEYENVQFVSVKDLQNKELLDNLTPDHIDRLMTDATQVSKELRTSKSRGTTSLKDTYKGIPGMESYTKILTNWRGEKKPSGRQGAHMYNMGGKVSGVQYFGTNIAQRIVKSVLENPTSRFGHRSHGGNPAEFQKETMLQSIFDIKDKFARVNKLVKFGFSPEEAGKLSKMSYNKALKTDIVKNKAFYAPGWRGGTTAASSGIYNLFQQQLKNIADSGINPEAIKRLSTQRGIGFGKIPPKKLVKVAKMLNTKEYRYILEGSIPYTREHAEFTSKVYSEFIKSLPENSVEAKTLIKVRNGLLKDSQLSPQDYLENVVKERIKAAHFVSGGKPKDIDKLFSNIRGNYTADDISKTILNADNPLLEGAKFKTKNKYTKQEFRNKEVKGKKHIALNSFLTLANKGGMIPGVQYAMAGKLIDDVMRTGKFGEKINKVAPLANAGESLMDKLATISTRRKYSWDKFPIQYLNPGATAGRRISGRKPRNVEIYDPVSKKVIGQYDVDLSNGIELRDLKNTLEIERSKGFKEAIARNIGEGFNKGGMIPGVQYAVKGKEIEQLGKIFGINANIPTVMAGALPTLKTQFQNKPKPFKKISEYVKDKSFIDNDTYFIYPRGGEPHEARIFMGRDGQLRKQRIGYEPDAVSKLDPNFRHGDDPRRYKEEILDPNFEAAIYNKNEYNNAGAETFRNKGGALKFNRGNIVPGVGSTDTVPAMLTPGEFVINKEATQKNLDLLHSINNGKTIGLNKGGMMPEVQYFAKNKKQRIVQPGVTAVGMGAGLAASIAVPMFMPEETSMKASIAASYAAWAVASKAATIGMLALTKQTITVAKVFPQLSKGIPALTSALGISATTLFGVIGPIAALSIGIVALNKMANNAVQSGGELIKSMYGSSERMKEFAKAFGRENTQQALARQRAESAAGAPIGQEAQQYSTQFIQSGAGAQLLKDAEAAQKIGGRAGRDEAILNQLTRGVVTGSITAEEAKAIALDIGTKLNDQSLGVRISGQISKLVGPNGEDIADNILAINAQINPIFDISKLEDIVKKQYENLGFFQKVGMKMFGKDTEDMLVDSLAEGAIQAKDITKEQIDFLKLELQNGNISYQEFVTKRNQIAMQSVNASEGAIEQINKRFGQGTDEAEKRIKQFRKEFEKEFQLNIKTDLGEKDAKSVNEFLNQFEKGGVEDKVVSGGKGGAIVVPAEKVNTQATEALKQLESETILAMSLIEDRDSANKKLEEIYAKDPAILGILDDYVAQGGDLEALLSKDIEDIEKYKESLDKLAAIPAELKDGIDTDKLIGDPDKLNAFIEETGKVKGILDEIKKNKNLSISAKMKLVADKFGKDSPMYKLLVEGQKQGLTVETLLDLGVTDEGKKIAAAYAILDDKNSSMPARGEALRTIAEFESKTAQDLKATQEGGDEAAKSPLQTFREGYKQLRKEAQSFYDMIGTGKNQISIESASLLQQNGLLGINAKERKKVAKEIKNQMAITAALGELAKSEEQKKIDAASQEISRIQRQNELDQRRIAIRQRALDEIAKKEQEINKAYDARVTALDAVAQMNQRLEQQRQSRISLAGALVSGDIGAAAQAASSMAANFAQYQTEDARSALEKSRADALAAVQVSVNGTLMTRQQIIDSINLIEEDIYLRNIQIQAQQDVIYEAQEAIRVKEEERVKEGIKLLSNAQSIRSTTNKALDDAINYTKELAKDVTKTITVNYVYQTSGRPSATAIAFGGQFAMGGMYKGSKEPPPMMKMAMGGKYKKYNNGGFTTGAGGLIPGLGNVDNYNALLMPGEYVVRKNATRAFKPLLDAMNYNVFPDMRDLIKTADIPNAPSMSNNNVITNNTPVYNSYNVSLNVPNSNASPEDIANAVAVQIKRISNSNIKGISR